MLELGFILTLQYEGKKCPFLQKVSLRLQRITSNESYYYFHFLITILARGNCWLLFSGALIGDLCCLHAFFLKFNFFSELSAMLDLAFRKSCFIQFQPKDKKIKTFVKRR